MYYLDEKRKFRRRQIIYYLRVFDQSTDQLLGHLVNITSEGAMIISENQIYALRTLSIAYGATFIDRW